MKALTAQELEAFFASLQSEYDVRVPVLLLDGTRTLAPVGEGPMQLAGGAVPTKVTNVFFPQLEPILDLDENGTQTETPKGAPPLLVVGFTAPDTRSLDFIDRFYSADLPDDVYLGKRRGAVVICVSGCCGPDGEFLEIAGEMCDIELICDGSRYLVAAYSETGKALAERIQGGVDADAATLADLQKRSDALSGEDAALIQAASKLLLEDKVPDEFWTSISDRCIACTSCTQVCPTCTCFEIFDRTAGGHMERWRLWDSCQLDGFMREASGHNPMGEERMRTRRRIHHKLAADVTRRNEITCHLCGRCDDVCPTGIGIKAVCREMVGTYGSS